MKKKAISCITVLLTLFFAASAQNIPIDKVLAVVGDNIILQSEVEAQYQQMQQQYQDSLPADARCQVFDNLLLDKLFLSQALIDSVTATPEEVDAELDRRLKYFISVFGSQDKLEEYYGKSVLELKDDFRDDIEKQLVSDKVKSKVFANLKVSPAEVKEYFEKIPKDSIPYFNSELELGELVMFPQVTAKEKEEARLKLESIRADIMKGSDFSAKAILYSDDKMSSVEGGKLGVVTRGEMVHEFDAVIFKLKQGEVSQVFETQFGYHIAIVDEILGDKLSVRHILIRSKTTSHDMDLVKERMDSILHELRVDSLSWREAINKFSEEPQSKSIGGMMTNAKTGSTFFEKSDIDGTLIFTIDAMKKGEYSNVLPHSVGDRGSEAVKMGYRIIWLKTETKPHKASLEEDYSKIQTAAKSQKQQQMLEKWLELHIDKNFVRIENEMKDCTQIKKWLKKTN